MTGGIDKDHSSLVLSFYRKENRGQEKENWQPTNSIISGTQPNKWRCEAYVRTYVPYLRPQESRPLDV